MIDRSLKKWTAEMSDEQLEQLVDAMYRILTATNAKTLTDLTHDRNWFWQLMTAGDPQSRKTVFSAVSQLTGEAGKQWLERTLPSLIKLRVTEDKASDLKQATEGEAVNEDGVDVSEPAALTQEEPAKATTRGKDPIDRVLERIVIERHKAQAKKSKCASCPRRESCPKIAKKKQCE